jgi:hypothetical protein
MAIIRHEAGTRVPADGMYALVGHYGEATGFAAWFEKGERLPLAVVSEEVENPLWFVRISEESSTRLAA